MARAPPPPFAPRRYAPECPPDFLQVRSLMADKLARAKLARAARRFAVQSGSALPSLILMTDDERLADPVAAARALPRGSMGVLRTRRSGPRGGVGKEMGG